MAIATNSYVARGGQLGAIPPIPEYLEDREQRSNNWSPDGQSDKVHRIYGLVCKTSLPSPN